MKGALLLTASIVVAYFAIAGLIIYAASISPGCQ